MFETYAPAPSLPSADGDLLAKIDALRLRADASLSAERRAELGQFMTPAPIARFMAGLFENLAGEVRLLDPGAGVGSLTAAFVDRYLTANDHGAAIHAAAYELDTVMLNELDTTLAACQRACAASGVAFDGQIHAVDFVEAATQRLREEGTFFAAPGPAYTHCIMNPPYRKIHSSSAWRQWLQQVGIETANLYSAFLALAVRLLAPGGELVAIVPRSFCNGVYFRPFRQFFLQEMALTHLHIFEARDQAFKENAVLQENIILHAVKGGPQGTVAITASFDAEFADLTWREAGFAQVVRPDDPDRFINIATTDSAQLVLERLSVFTSTLDDLGLTVSTGPVVDFRLRDNLRPLPEPGAHPLIYPAHFSRGFVTWPKPAGRKPNAIAETAASRPWLLPNGWYVLTRRFSAKEEKRRIVAAVHEPSRVPGTRVGFENHLNVFHRAGQGLEPDVAKGLALYLNSTLVDLYFRQFSGHTQVNAADLRSLHYPTSATLERLGRTIIDVFPDQIETDLLLNAEILNMTSGYQTSDPVQMQRKIQEAQSVNSQSQPARLK
jgi:adenine-specific DNA-methyltransferase